MDDESILVEVLWADAHVEPTGGGTWFDRADIGGDPYIVRSVGLLLPGAKANHVSIAQSEAVVDALVDSVLHIPTGMVRDVRRLAVLPDREVLP